MICETCAWEADGNDQTSEDWLKEAVQRWHNFGAVSAPFGHGACKGASWCDCAHKHKGAWRGE